MDWPSDKAIAAMVELPEGYRFARLTRDEIPALVRAIAQWHPDISVGVASCYLRQDFFFDEAVLDGGSQKDLLVILIKCDDVLAGMGSWER